MPPTLRRNAIPIGTDTATNQALYLNRKWLDEKNVHIIGPPGEGKTRFLLHLYQCACRVPRSTVILVNPKGALARMARDWTLSHGLTRRLIWFDPGDPNARIGYNPLWPNGLPVAAHAKAVREAIRSAWGQANLDATPQLARLLLLALGVCRALHLTIADAVELLRSGPAGAPLRRRVIPALAGREDHRFFHQALAWFDSLTERRQDELGASTLARLEAFISDPAIASMLTAPRSLDIGEIIRDHRILLVNLEIKRPLAQDDVRLLGRMLVNDIVSRVFARQAPEDGPVYLLIDECHQFLTDDLAQILDMGRELNCHVIAAHQNLDQLRQEDVSQRVYGAVMKSARVKAIFGDGAADDLDILLRDAMIDGYDPMKVKDELTSLELDPIETSRLVFTVSNASGYTSGFTRARSRGTSRSTFESEGTSVGIGHAISSGHASGAFAGMSVGEMILANGDVNVGSHETSGTTSGDFESESSGDTESWSSASGVQDTVSESEAKATTEATNYGRATSYAQVPFYEYRKRRNVSARTFETEQEYLTKCLQTAKAQPVGHFILKLPKQPALFVRGPHVREPWISERQRKANLDRVYAQPCYEKLGDKTPMPANHPYQLPPAKVEFGTQEPSAAEPHVPDTNDDFFLR